MNSIIRIIKNVFRNKGKNIALMAVLTICFMLGIFDDKCICTVKFAN